MSDAMELLEQCLRQAEVYPRWLVISSIVLTVIAALWIVAKLFSWALNLLLALIIITAVVGALVWWLGG